MEVIQQNHETVGARILSNRMANGKAYYNSYNTIIIIYYIKALLHQKFDIFI